VKNMIELIVGDGKPLQNASIPIRWCINAETLNRIRDAGGEDAQIMLVSVDERGGEERALIPLSQGMTYFDIRRPGTSIIHARVVWAQPEVHLNKLKNRFLTKEYGEYEYRVLDFHKEISLDNSSLTYCVFDDSAKIEVVIPPELFGKEPPEWFKFYINLWSSRATMTSMVDECSWRRRVLNLFLFKIWAIVAYVVVFEFIGVVWIFMSTMIGFTANYGALKKPLTTSVSDLLRNKQEPFLLNPKGKSNFAKLWPVVFTPIYLIICVMAAMLITRSTVFDVSLLVIFSGILGGLVVVPIFVALVYLIIQGLPKLLNKIIRYNSSFSVNNVGEFIAKQLTKFGNWLEGRRVEKAKEHYEESYKYLTCAGPAKVATISEVPVRDRTIRLIFQAVKNKVCKPMPK
jgi:hypothetical protein